MLDKILKVLTFCLLFFGYLLLNVGIDDYFSGFEYLFIVGIMLWLVALGIIIKKKYYKLSIIYITVLFVYSIFYTFVLINNDHKYSFLEKIESYKYEENDYYKESDLESCIDDENCNYKKALSRKIKNIDMLLNNPEGFKSVTYLNYKLSNILKNKKIVENKGLAEELGIDLEKDFYIDFDISDYIKQSLTNSYINTLSSADLDNYNLLFSGNQFKKYSKDYYYSIYDSMKTAKYSDLEKYHDYNLFLFFVNRKYKYNVYLDDIESITEYKNKIEETYEIVSEINKEQ